MTEFVPVDFVPPREAVFGQYLLRPLTEADAAADCIAVNENMELIRQIRGGNWPKSPITAEEDVKDLKEHARQFAAREAFAFTLVDSVDTARCAGCVYIYPPHHPFDDTDQSVLPDNADAAVSFWITQATYDAGMYPKFFQFIREWLTREWPFVHPCIVNAEKP